MDNLKQIKWALELFNQEYGKAKYLKPQEASEE